MHPRRPDDPDRSSHSVRHLVGREHQAALAQATAGVLPPDHDLNLFLEGHLLQNAGQLCPLLEQLQQLFQPADLDELGMTQQVAHPIVQHYRLPLRLVDADRLDHPLDDLPLLVPIGAQGG